MNKKVNENAMVMRLYKDFETGKNELRKVERPVASCKVGEEAWCPECDEAVILMPNAKPPHYEHKSRAGKVCSFKHEPS